MQQSKKRVGPTALYHQLLSRGIPCTLDVVKNALSCLQQSTQQQLLQGFQTLPAVLDFLAAEMGAYTAIETEPPDRYGGRRFLHAIVILQESLVRHRGMGKIFAGFSSSNFPTHTLFLAQGAAVFCRPLCFEDSCHAKTMTHIKYWLLSTYVRVCPSELKMCVDASHGLLNSPHRLDGNDQLVTIGMAVIAGETKENVKWCLEQITLAGLAVPAFAEWWEADGEGMAHFMDRGAGLGAIYEAGLDNHVIMYV